MFQHDCFLGKGAVVIFGVFDFENEPMLVLFTLIVASPFGGGGVCVKVSVA